MKISFKAISLAAAMAMLLFGLGSKALAASPNLSISNAGGDNVNIIINNADAYAQVQLLYTASGSQLPTQINNFGQTNGSGYFSTVISGNAYGLSGGTQVYVRVNGQQSNIVNWNTSGTGCGYYGCNVGGLTLNPSSLNLNVGQSSTVNISSGVNMSAYPPYVSSNSNSGVATASISGQQMTVYGNSSGSTTITVCLSGGTCGYLYVTVSGSNYNNISFSQANVSLNANQSQNITIYGSGNYANNYYVSNNSNPSAVTASVSGSTLYLYGQNSGSSTITVCQSGSGNCGNVYATVSGASSGNWSLSQANVTVNAGQTVTVNANFPYMFTGSLSVGSNSNSNVATVTFSGSTIYVYGQNAGNATISICNNNNCNNLYVTVVGNSGTISLSQNSVSLNQGQNQLLTIYNNNYNNNYYISANTNSSIVTPTLSGNTLNLYGNTPGYSTVTVCQSGYSNVCASVSVTVANYSTGGLSFVTTSLPQPAVNQYYSYQLQAMGGSAPYSYSLYSGQLPAGLSLSNSGQIFGVPQNNASAYFSVRASDNYGRNGTSNFVLTPGGVLGITYYKNGTLINDNGTIYLIYRNTKTGFASAAAFTGLGFSFNSAIPASISAIPHSGYTVNSASGVHPWGSWIRSGGTVYFVHEQGLIPIPDWNVFVNNGGNSDLVIPGNSYDFQRPILPIMVMEDTRLK